MIIMKTIYQVLFCKLVIHKIIKFQFPVMIVLIKILQNHFMSKQFFRQQMNNILLI